MMLTTNGLLANRDKTVLLNIAQEIDTTYDNLCTFIRPKTKTKEPRQILVFLQSQGFRDDLVKQEMTKALRRKLDLFDSVKKRYPKLMTTVKLNHSKGTLYKGDFQEYKHLQNVLKLKSYLQNMDTEKNVKTAGRLFQHFQNLLHKEKTESYFKKEKAPEPHLEDSSLTQLLNPKPISYHKLHHIGLL